MFSDSHTSVKEAKTIWRYRWTQTAAPHRGMSDIPISRPWILMLMVLRHFYITWNLFQFKTPNRNGFPWCNKHFPVFWRNISHKQLTDIITGSRGLKLCSYSFFYKRKRLGQKSLRCLLALTLESPTLGCDIIPWQPFRNTTSVSSTSEPRRTLVIL